MTVDQVVVETVEIEEDWAHEASSLYVYENPTLEGVESAWTTLDSAEDRVYWMRGAILDAVSRTSIYGDSGIEKFCGRMNYSVSSAYDVLATYRRVRRLDEAVRERVLALDLRNSHYRVASAVRDDALYESLLTRAATNGWIVGRLAEAVQVSLNAARSDELFGLGPPDTTDDTADTEADTDREESENDGGDTGHDGGHPGLSDSDTSGDGAWPRRERAPSAEESAAARDRDMVRGFLELLDAEGVSLVDLASGEVVFGYGSDRRLGALLSRYVGSFHAGCTGEED